MSEDKRYDEAAELRTLRGGNTGKRFHLGPILAKESYSTVRHGWADAIQCEAGEVVACVSAGDVGSFARWVRGPIADVVAHLRTLGDGIEERAKFSLLAQEIETGNREAPVMVRGTFRTAKPHAVGSVVDDFKGNTWRVVTEPVVASGFGGATWYEFQVERA